MKRRRIFLTRKENYTTQFGDFLQQVSAISKTMATYNQEPGKVVFFTNSSNAAYVTRVGTELKKFGELVSADRLLLYGMDKRLVSGYYREQGLEESGVYAISASGNDTFIPAAEFSNLVMVAAIPLPDIAIPDVLDAHYDREFPDILVTQQIHDGQRLGLQIIVPVFQRSEKIGMLVGKIYYTQEMMARYAALSQTNVNLFVENRWIVGTLPAQDTLEAEALAELVSCDALLNREAAIEVIPAAFDEQQEPNGAISVSLSQDVEQQEIQKLLRSVLGASAVVGLFAIVISLFVSRKSVTFIQQLILYIRRIAKGDLPETIAGNYKGEFQEIQQNVNTLIEAMHGITSLAEDIANGDVTVEVGKRSEQDTLMQALYMMMESLREVTQLAEKIADGDLTLEVATRSEKDRLMQALDAMVSRLNSIVLDVKATADHVASGQ